MSAFVSTCTISTQYFSFKEKQYCKLHLQNRELLTSYNLHFSSVTICYSLDAPICAPGLCESQVDFVFFFKVTLFAA